MTLNRKLCTDVRAKASSVWRVLLDGPLRRWVPRYANILHKIVPFFAFLVGASVVQSAGFDCAKASAHVERLICSSPVLSEADTKLSQRYEHALAGSRNPAALRRQQREWLRDIRNRCHDEACLRSAYLRRIAVFEWATKTGKKNPLCEEFLSQENRRPGLAAHALDMEEIAQQDATHTIRNIDVDGDKQSDRLFLYLTGSASLVPPDNSSFSLVLSSTTKEHKVEAQHLYVFGYVGRYYLHARNFLGEEGPVATDVYLLGRSGIQKICSFECSLPDGNCEVND